MMVRMKTVKATVLKMSSTRVRQAAENQDRL